MEVIQQCPNCNSQGEIMNTERIILELEDKLKQTEGVKNESD